jgi:hypothetical protein
MPSKDSKTPEKDEAKVVKFKAGEDTGSSVAKKKGGVTLTQIITYVILGLLAIVLVAGVFPSFGTQGSATSIQFGSYDGTPIEFSFGNYFYQQYQTQAQQNRGSGDSAAYQIWRAAFESTVFHTAVTKMAERAGIRVVDETLNKAIIDSGAYDKDGKFDVGTYEKASVESKNQLKTQYEQNLPVQMVMEDVATVLSSPAEMDYIVAMGDSARSFEYVAFDSSTYPDDLAREYAMANPALFTLIDVSVITVADRETAETLRASIVDGDITFEEAARTDSIDGFSEEGGRAGIWYLHELQGNFANPEEVNALFSTAEGTVSTVYDAPGGAAFYRVEKKPFLADFEDKEVLSDVKNYIGTNDATVISAYLEQEAQEFSQLAASSSDFATAATDAGYEVVSVEATPANIGGSNYLTGFSYTDPAGHLNRLANDSEAMGTLYSLEVGSVSEPLASGDIFVVAKVVQETPMDEETRDYLKLVYPYMSQSQSQQDMVQSIFTSEKFEDDFLMSFMENIMGIEGNN